MLVNNKHGKIIGIGPFTLLPGETGELPKGYDKNHPVISFYFEKGFLVEAELENFAEAEAEARAKEEAEARAKADAETILHEALAGMSLEELQAEAKELGIKTTNKDTIETLTQKITEKNSAE